MSVCCLQLNRPSPPIDDWELEPSEIAFQEKIASGAFGDLYKGAYCGQDVAIKIVRNVQDNTQQFQEFIQVSTCVADSLSDANRLLLRLLTSTGTHWATNQQLIVCNQPLKLSCLLSSPVDNSCLYQQPLGQKLVPQLAAAAGSDNYAQSAAQERCPVHWSLHPQAQPVHRV